MNNCITLNRTIDLIAHNMRSTLEIIDGYSGMIQHEIGQFSPLDLDSLALISSQIEGIKEQRKNLARMERELRNLLYRKDDYESVKKRLTEVPVPVSNKGEEQ